MWGLLPRFCIKITNLSPVIKCTPLQAVSVRFLHGNLIFPVTRRPNLNFQGAKSWFSSSGKGIQDQISPLMLKKRVVRKRKLVETPSERPPGSFNVVAYATAEEYDLEALLEGLKQQDLYEPTLVPDAPDVLHAVAKYQVESEPREIFFFREGSAVLWNIEDLESSNVLDFLHKYEHDRYSAKLVQEESESMNYKRICDVSKDETVPVTSRLDKNGDFLVNENSEVLLDKYAFSDAMVSSVKLGIWEASLEKYIDTIEYITEDLKKGNRIKMTRGEVLRRHGELFALRHLINLSSDLLDTPDFYWDNERLESLYLQVCGYFGISKRTRVMNEKINHCVELIELLSTHLSDKHHVRLEWMIIVLIMVEVAFEMIHYVHNYLA